jgi:general stress protein 26
MAIPSDADLKAKILRILDEHQVMTVATVRPDGWPQATLVGYAHDQLALYFVVSIGSQKLQNIRQDPRVSIAIGRQSSGRPQGLSMAARVQEVNDPEEIQRLNLLIANRYPEVPLFPGARLVGSGARHTDADLNHGPDRRRRRAGIGVRPPGIRGSAGDAGRSAVLMRVVNGEFGVAGQAERSQRGREPHRHPGGFPHRGERRRGLRIFHPHGGASRSDKEIALFIGLLIPDHQGGVRRSAVRRREHRLSPISSSS